MNRLKHSIEFPYMQFYTDINGTVKNTLVNSDEDVYKKYNNEDFFKWTSGEFSEYMPDRLSKIRYVYSGTYSIYSVSIKGNFFSGGVYQISIDSFFVHAKSKEHAMQISKENLIEIKKHFQSKRYHNKKMALRKSEEYNFKVNDLYLAKSTGLSSNYKVLTSTGEFKEINLDTNIKPEDFKDAETLIKSFYNKELVHSARNLEKAMSIGLKIVRNINNS